MTSWRDLLPGAPPRAYDALALGIELRQREAYDPARWEARAVVAVTPRLLARRQDDLQLVARPLVRGARETWIRADATWDAVRRSSGRFDPAHVRWFAELHALAQAMRTTGPFAAPGDTVALDAVDSPLLWPHLAAAAGLGIPLVAVHAQQSVRLADAAEARVAVDAVDGGGLRLSADVRIDATPVPALHARPIGGSGLFAFALDRDPVPIVLAPVTLPAPLPALLGTDGVEIPRAEAEEFLADAYPRLARRAPLSLGAGVPPPPAPRPTLEVTVVHADDEVSYRLEWVYPGSLRFAYDSEGPDAEPGSDAPGDAFPATAAERDARAEAQIGERFETTWMAASDLAIVGRARLNGADAAAFTTRVLPAVDVVDEVRVRTSGTVPTFRELRGDPTLRITAVESVDRDWFDLGIVVTIDGRTIPFGMLFSALSRGRARIKLSDGAWFSLAHPSLQRLRDLLEEAAALDEWETGPRLPRTHLALWAEFEDLADQSEAAVEWRALARALREVGEVPPVPTPPGFSADLRPYQREGLSWLALLHGHRLGGILADDMGLGKTLQLLALVAHTRANRDERPWLVVAPTSVLPTWRDEAARFAPGLRVRVVEATAVRRAHSIAGIAAEVDVVVASYGVVRADAAEFSVPHWSGVVLDEAQFVKNPATRIHRAIAGLSTDAVFAATGTPLENGLDDLWALLSLTAPGLFPSIRQFREDYTRAIEQLPTDQPTALSAAAASAHREKTLERLRRRVRPFLLRRTKDVVASDLPPKQEQEIVVPLSPAHQEVYDRVLQRERQKVLGLLDDLDRQRFIVFRSLTLLRMLALAPGLVDDRDAHLGSAKLDVLLERLVEVAAEGHRALVFSQFTSFLDLAAERLDAAGLAYAHLDGSTARRGDVVEGFREGDAPVFLISLKAGGFGLTLVEAEYVFLLDPWWNPAAENQAIDRAHRIGQTKSVFVYRLLAAGTVEEKVRALQHRKAALFDAVIDDDDAFAGSLDADDIRSLLGP
ncbi:Superfamily II DNA or RNA helicase, SNF2 family [Microbacterium sp. ru370.1]|uniref:DEAD/DEAH box helicase n=1 Tax=unclassified Microbacterium TaxID=2609290 RepID=UPI00088E84F8|nr:MULTISPECIES: DEAD/DEAH box helicase [unclassified Microbacterium]SDO75025.1 Superfamily II DNA or RNA helicase, SNF2 family [Microbacterium sp. ru370.1]SIT88243.1 Superfamily II DNA or RNA helicase, SNF2 family [Microbacterium sp. RU1D]